MNVRRLFVFIAYNVSAMFSAIINYKIEIMANWDVLNKEFDELIEKLTDKDWEQFEIYLKAKKQALNIACVIKAEGDSVCKMCGSDNTEIVTYQICKNCGL